MVFSEYVKQRILHYTTIRRVLTELRLFLRARVKLRDSVKRQFLLAFNVSVYFPFHVIRDY